MRIAGGPAAVRKMIKTKHLGAVRFSDGERALQSRIAGLTLIPAYSIGNAFFEARDALPQAVRKAAFDRYVDKPYDGAAPSAIVNALASLKRGAASLGVYSISAWDDEPYPHGPNSPERRPRAWLVAEPQDGHRTGAWRRTSRV